VGKRGLSVSRVLSCEQGANALFIGTIEAMRKNPSGEGLAFPEEVTQILRALSERGHSAYAVGGCVRDLLLGRPPKDWDVATDAKPEEIQAIFSRPEGGTPSDSHGATYTTSYENRFGTVGVKTASHDPALAVVEVTTFRVEGKYTDKRHPDELRFAKTIDEDLARRDFSINAMASTGRELVDPFGGRADLAVRRIRAVGDPNERFTEDALRLMRAVRFATELEFVIEEETAGAILRHAGLLEMIAKERVAEELRRILMASRGDSGLALLRELGLLRSVLPELEEGWSVTQNKHHIYTVWEHNLRSLRYTCERGYSFEVRMASLLHDVGKPRVKRGEGPDSTFYGHEVVGARMATHTLSRLKFSREEIEKIALLVRAHMFNYDPEVVTDASVRRLVAKVGPENIRELVQVREADRIGSGVPKAVPYRLRHFVFRVEKVLTEPVSRKQMKLNGDDLIKALGLAPGPRLGAILDALFEEVLDDPSRNEREALLKRAEELNGRTDEDLARLRREAQEKYQAVLTEEEEAMKRKHRV